MNAVIYILASIGAITIGVWIGAFLRGFRTARERKTPPPPVTTITEPQHCVVTHELTPIDCRPIHLNDIPHTIVMAYCQHCRGHRALTYLGTWPLETFLKKESDLARDIARLEGMVK